MSEFKAGDLIVCVKGKTAEVLEIISVWHDRYHCVSTTSPSSIVLKSHIEHWRKAKPEEIKAGHRIDNDMGDDFPIENRISPNCKLIGE